MPHECCLLANMLIELDSFFLSYYLYAYIHPCQQLNSSELLKQSNNILATERCASQFMEESSGVISKIED